mgnify:CR=1 FL=1
MIKGVIKINTKNAIKQKNAILIAYFLKIIKDMQSIVNAMQPLTDDVHFV